MSDKYGEKQVTGKLKNADDSLLTEDIEMDKEQKSKLEETENPLGILHPKFSYDAPSVEPVAKNATPTEDCISRQAAIDAEDGKMIQLLHGDCLELMKDIPDKSIDMILCDLPYGLTHCDWDIPLDMESMWNQYKRVIKDHGGILLFSIQPFTSDLIQSNRKMFRYEIVWQKTQPSGFLNAHRMPLRGHENIVVFYKHLPTYNPQMRTVETKQLGRKKTNGTKAKQYNDYMVGTWQWEETGKRFPTDVICFSNWNGALFGKTDKATKHPTQKPIPLLEYLIKTYTNEGDTVLDNCMGSGSTGVACVNLNRNFIGMELKEEYFEIAKERIHKAQTEPKQLILFEEDSDE